MYIDVQVIFPSLYESMYYQEREINYLMSTSCGLFVLPDIACQKMGQQFTCVAILENWHQYISGIHIFCFFPLGGVASGRWRPEMRTCYINTNLWCILRLYTVPTILFNTYSHDLQLYSYNLQLYHSELIRWLWHLCNAVFQELHIFVSLMYKLSGNKLMI